MNFNPELVQGFFWMILGMLVVFILFGIFFLIMWPIQRFSKKKEINISIPSNPQTSNIEQMEKIAVIAAALTFVDTRHNSLLNSERKL